MTMKKKIAIRALKRKRERKSGGGGGGFCLDGRCWGLSGETETPSAIDEEIEKFFVWWIDLRKRGKKRRI